MINNIIIIYIEGDENRQPKGEKYLLESPSSRNVWEKYFVKIGFKEFLFVRIPKKFTIEKNKNKFYKILDKKISKFLSTKNENKKFLYLLITGDYDEKYKNELIDRKKIANEINDKYFNNKNIWSKVLLPKNRNKNFNLELIMSEMVGEKVTKKELKKRIDNKYPTIDELMKYPKKEMTNKDFINNLLNSKHLLFKEINNIKNIINKE